MGSAGVSGSGTGRDAGGAERLNSDCVIVRPDADDTLPVFVEFDRVEIELLTLDLLILSYPSPWPSPLLGEGTGLLLALSYVSKKLEEGVWYILSLVAIVDNELRIEYPCLERERD